MQAITHDAAIIGGEMGIAEEMEWMDDIREARKQGRIEALAEIPEITPEWLLSKLSTGKWTVDKLEKFAQEINKKIRGGA